MPKYHKGDYHAECDICGFKYLASELKKRWDGLMACPSDWEPRQSQDFVKGVSENTNTPWSRTEPAATYVAVCTLSGRSGIAGYASAGCAIVGYVPPDGIIESQAGYYV